MCSYIAVSNVGRKERKEKRKRKTVLGSNGTRRHVYSQYVFPSLVVCSREMVLGERPRLIDAMIMHSCDMTCGSSCTQ